MKKSTASSKSKAIALASCTIVCSAALIAGATFALITATDENKVNVTSGKINVETSFSQLSGKSLNGNYEAAEGNSYEFATRGVAQIDDNGNLIMSNVAPGDYAKACFVSANESTIKIGYRLKVSGEIPATFELNVFGADGETELELAEENGALVSDWQVTETIGGEISDYYVEIGIPEAVKETAEETTITVSLEAVQANGVPKYDVEAGEDAAENGAALTEAIENAEEGDTLYISEGTYALASVVDMPAGVSLLGVQQGVPASEWANDESAPRTVITAPDSGDRVIRIEQNDGETITDVTIDGIEVDCAGKDVKGIFVKKNAGEAMTGIVIKNNYISNCNNDGIDVNNTNGAVIEGNIVDTVFDNGIKLESYKNSDGVIAYIRNNIVRNSLGQGTINGAISVTNGKGDVVVSGNTIENIKRNGQTTLPTVDMGESAIIIESVNEGGVITVENNTITNVDQGIAVYKFSAAQATDKVIIRNNTISGAKVFGIATGSLNYSKFANTALVEISGNTITTLLVENGKGKVFIEKTNRYNETTSGWKVIVNDTEYTDAIESSTVID